MVQGHGQQQLPYPPMVAAALKFQTSLSLPASPHPQENHFQALLGHCNPHSYFSPKPGLLLFSSPLKCHNLSPILARSKSDSTCLRSYGLETIHRRLLPWIILRSSLTSQNHFRNTNLTQPCPCPRHYGDLLSHEERHPILGPAGSCC